MTGGGIVKSLLRPLDDQKWISLDAFASSILALTGCEEARVDAYPGILEL